MSHRLDCCKRWEGLCFDAKVKGIMQTAEEKDTEKFEMKVCEMKHINTERNAEIKILL